MTGKNERAMRSPLEQARRRFAKNRAALAACLFLLLLVVVAATSPLFQGGLLCDPAAQDLSAALRPPSASHPFGTDALGRDVLARTIAGARISLLVGLLATLVTLVIGVAYGSIAGFAGGAADTIMMRAVDVLYTLPFIFFVILLLSLFERSFLMLFAALGAVQWLTMARMVRGQILSLKERDFVSAARAVGAGPIRIVSRHLLPNALGIVIVYATLTVPVIILQESFLSFLGLTVPGQEHSWGTLLSEAVECVNPVNISWWLIVFPGSALTATLLALNFLGDGLRNALDPR